MISVIGSEFFYFNIELSKNYTHDHCVLIRLFTDPSYFELPQYKKSAFISIVAYDFEPYLQDENGQDTEVYYDQEWYHVPRTDKNYLKQVERVIDYLRTHSFDKYSMYVDGHYGDLTRRFSTTNHYHTLIFEEVRRDNFVANHFDNFCVIGHPVQGIISPIQRSDLFDLYNASLVVMNNTPFNYTGDHTQSKRYTKLMYVLVNVYSHFTYTEYVKDDSSELNGRGKVITNVVGISDEKCDSMNRVSIENIVDIYNQKHEYFDGKINKNIFYLTDIPKSIKLRSSGQNGDMSVMLPASN